MKKIKKFKINIRKNYLISTLKSAYNFDQINPEIMEVIDKEISRAKEYLEPQVIFETFQLHILKEKLNMVIEQNEKIIACTLVILTIGDKIKKEVLSIEKKGEDFYIKLLNSIGIEACNSGLNFVTKLLKEDAENEDCELLSPVKIIDREIKEKLINFMSAEKINVKIDSSGNVFPFYTTFAYIPWKYIKKLKTPSTQRKET